MLGVQAGLHDRLKLCCELCSHHRRRHVNQTTSAAILRLHRAPYDVMQNVDVNSMASSNHLILGVQNVVKSL